MNKFEISTSILMNLMEESTKFALVRDYVINCGNNYIDREILKVFLDIKGEKKDV